MPVEFGLEFVAVVSPHFPNAERELFNDVVDEVDRVRLGVQFVHPCASGQSVEAVAFENAVNSCI